MKKSLKKAVTWLMIVCTVFSFLSVFGSAAAVEEKPNQSTEWSSKTVFFATQPEGELEEMRSDNLFDLLADFVKAIIKNLQSLSVDEILNLPANAMDDLITYVFAVFKLFGVNIDTLYEKISSVFNYI